ncbi:MAG TPA: CGNR zinc finger domain-containing protein [Acidimicrobiales bacterium]
MVSTPYNDADVELVRSFANTVDAEDGTDRLASIDEFRSWLRDQDLDGARQPIGDDDLALARDLRGALRAEMASHHDDVPDAAAQATLDRLAADLPVQIVPSTGALEPVARGSRGALTRVLAATHSLLRAGVWNRLKVCPDDDCAWAFYDESRNRSRRWCSMKVCGNRHKVRAYRDRLGE